MKRARKLNSSIVLDGKEIPVLNWRASLGSQGSLGTASATTSIALLRYAGINLVTAAQKKDGASFDIYAGFEGDYQHIFGGVMDSVRLDMKADTVTLEGRDHGANLVDARMTISKIKYKNKKVSEIVKQIAEEHDLEADVEETDMMAGIEMWDSHAYIPHSQPWWSVIQSLAQQVGFEAKITPDKKLYFGPPGADSSNTFTVTWGAGPDESPEHPLIDCEIFFSPRRNKSFEVRVLSYHPQRAEMISGNGTPQDVENAQGGGQKSGTTAMGTSKGRAVKNFKGGRSSSKPSKKPVFTYHMDGLSAEQAMTKAQAIADDLAKRQVVITCTAEGIPDLKIHSKIKLRGSRIDMMGFDSREYVVTGVNHTYNMPQEGGNDGGLQTELIAASPAEAS